MVALLSSKRLTVGVRRGRGGQRLFLDRAAGGADGLALEVGGAGDRDRLGAEHAGEERRIGDREVDDLFALLVLAEAGDHEVGLVGLQIGNAVGAGHRDDLGLHPEFLADQIGHVDVVALRLEIEAGGAERRKILRHRDLDHLRLHDGIEGVGMGLRRHRGSGNCGGKQQFLERHSRRLRGYADSPPPRLLSVRIIRLMWPGSTSRFDPARRLAFRQCWAVLFLAAFCGSFSSTVTRPCVVLRRSLNPSVRDYRRPSYTMKPRAMASLRKARGTSFCGRCK